jgi:hypothetical protein
MKKILLLFTFFIGALMINAQTATSSLQTVGNNTLTVIKQKLDTVNSYLRSNAGTKAGENLDLIAIRTGGALTRLDYLYSGIGSMAVGDINYRMKQKLDTVNQKLREIDYNINGQSGVTPTAPDLGFGTWGEGIVQYLNNINSSFQADGSNAFVNIANTPTVDIAPTTTVNTNVNFNALSSETTIVSSASFAPASSASLIINIKPQTGTGIKINYIKITGTQTTAGNVVFKIHPITSQPTGGSASGFYGVDLNTGSAVNIQDIKFYTANPTGGGAVLQTIACIGQEVVPIPAPGTITTNAGYTWDFTKTGTNKPRVLTSGANSIAIFMEGVTLTGGVIRFEISYNAY